MRHSKIVLTAAIAALFSASVMATDTDLSDKAVKERTMPVGSVHIAGAAAVSTGARSGADIYSASCVMCHGAGLMNAPKAFDSADWAPRQEQGFEALLDHAINGFNAMPAKGGCMDCSDDEIKAAIEHMLGDA